MKSLFQGTGQFSGTGIFNMNILSLGTPTGLSAPSGTISNTSAVINFTPGTGTVDGYYAYNNGDQLSNSSVAYSSSTPNQITLSSLTSGASYVITLVAYNQYGTSSISSSVSFTTISYTPDAPTNLTIGTMTSNSAVINFTPGNGTITGYIVFDYGVPLHPVYTPLYTPPSSITITNLDSGRTHDIFLLAYYEIDGERYTSEPSSTISFTT